MVYMWWALIHKHIYLEHTKLGVYSTPFSMMRGETIYRVIAPLIALSSFDRQYYAIARLRFSHGSLAIITFHNSVKWLEVVEKYNKRTNVTKVKNVSLLSSLHCVNCLGVFSHSRCLYTPERKVDDLFYSPQKYCMVLLTD